MKTFNGRVAVITGAAGGIGRSIAERCVREGMKVVLADIDGDALARTEKDMKSSGADALAVRTDVSRAADVESLAKKALDSFGAVHLLCNNAGVETMSTICNGTPADWEWVMGVNLWGVIHGVRSFLPAMLARDTGGHIVNTASVVGLAADPYVGVYKVSKQAIIGLSETLYCELAQQGAKVGVSVLCPAWVNTRFLDSGRNRPAGLKDDPREKIPGQDRLREAFRESIRTGMSPEEVAGHMFRGVRENKLYILTHPETKDRIRTRMENILLERNPVIGDR